LSDETKSPAATQEAEDFFDASFLEELEQLSHVGAGPDRVPLEVSGTLHERLAEVMAVDPESPGGRQLTEDEFAALSGEAIAERSNALLAICRQ
jgi:hypothetical protein